MSKPIAVTLFSGVGGSSLALRNLGYEVYPHDFNGDAVASLVANGFVNAHRGDVRTVDWKTRFAGMDVKVLEGGPPCQPFSQSHEGDGAYDPRDMIPEFLRAIRDLQPETFVMEEVQTLTWARHRAYFERVIDDMRDLGYRVTFRVLDSSDYGTPQKRRRLIVVGKRYDLGVQPVFPATCPDFARSTMAQALGWTMRDCYDRNLAVPDPRAHVVATDKADMALWPLTRAAVTVVGSFRPEVAAAPGYRVKGDPPRQATPGSVVTTLVERLVLQDFPRDWIVCGNEASRALQVGNSVPVRMMQAVIEANQ